MEKKTYCSGKFTRTFEELFSDLRRTPCSLDLVFGFVVETSLLREQVSVSSFL